MLIQNYQRYELLSFAVDCSALAKFVCVLGMQVLWWMTFKEDCTFVSLLIFSYGGWIYFFECHC